MTASSNARGNAHSMLGAIHATNATYERNVRVQDPAKNRAVPDAAGAVDNPKSDRQHVEFYLPKQVWFELANIADDHDLTIPELIASAIRDVIGTEHARLAAARKRRENVIALARAGHTDAVISERLNETRGYVGATRRRAGIPANRPGMANHQKETA